MSKITFKELPDFNVPTGTPFRRVMITQERIRRTIAATPAGMVRDLALREIVYQGRGKGRSKNSGETILSLLARVNRPNKYQPHQGKQEIARRAARGW